MSKSGMLPIITICVLLTIISIVVIARGSFAANDKFSILTIQSYNEIVYDHELNESERTVLCMLVNADKLLIQEQKKETYIEKTYVKYLKDYFIRPKTELSKSCAYEAREIIINIFTVLSYEKETSIRNMSLDGKGTVTNLFEQLFDKCGLKLVHNLSGNIIKVSNAKGYLIFEKENWAKPLKFYFNDFMIILVIIMILISFGAIIARRNQLFIKEVGCNECNEEGA